MRDASQQTPSAIENHDRLFLYACARKGLESCLNDAILLPCINQIIVTYVFPDTLHPEPKLYSVQYTWSQATCESCGDPCECRWEALFSEERHQVWTSWEMLRLLVASTVLEDRGDNPHRMEETLWEMLDRLSSNRRRCNSKNKMKVWLEKYEAALSVHALGGSCTKRPMLHDFVSPEIMDSLYPESQWLLSDLNVGLERPTFRLLVKSCYTNKKRRQ